MNTCALVGRVHKWNADMRTIPASGIRFLSCVVAYEKKFPNGKRFTEKFRVLMFGKNAETICPQLKAGTLVMVNGEVGLDKPKDEEQKRDTMLKIVGQVSVVDPGESPTLPTASPKPAEPEKEESSDDIPF